MPLCLGIGFGPLKKMLTLKIGTENTHVCQHQIVVIWHIVSLQSATRSSRSMYQSQLPLLCGSQSHYNSLLRELRHPFPTLPSTLRPWHAAPLISSLINRTAHRPMWAPPASPSPSSQKGDEMHGNEGRFQPDQFPELSPTKGHTGTTKDATLWQFKFICNSGPCCHSFPPALHSHTLPRTSTCLTCQPVLGARPAENYSTPSQRCFLLGQLPWIGSLSAGGPSVPLWFCSLKSTSLVWQIVMNPQSKGACNCRSKKQEMKMN